MIPVIPDSAAGCRIEPPVSVPVAAGAIRAETAEEEPPEEPHRIDQIIVLAPFADYEGVRLVERHGAERLRALIGHTRRDGIAPMVLGDSRYFELLARLSAAAPVSTLHRRRQDWTLDAVLDLIESGQREGSIAADVIDLRERSNARVSSS